MTSVETKSKTLTIQLPWPPTANTYWRRHGHTYFISAKGIQYRLAVCKACIQFRNYFPKDKRLQVLVEAYPPDKRRRDLDNIFKCLLDSLEKATVYVNDSQIDKLTVWRCMPYDGLAVVTIAEID